ncbi:MAG TPA: hypothetical protein VFV54_12070 [Thermoanaerobaculia bacterium]|nr:hypothetical protein [Thermoanaerobaculia bacterium]
MASLVRVAALAVLWALPPAVMDLRASTPSGFRVPSNAVVAPTKDRGVLMVSWSVELVDGDSRHRLHASYPRLTRQFGTGYEEINRVLEADVITTYQLSADARPIEGESEEEAVEGESDERVGESWHQATIAFRRGPLLSVEWVERSEGGVHPDAFFGGFLFLVEKGKVRSLRAADAFTTPDAAERVVELLADQVPEEMADYCLRESDLISAVFAVEGIRLTLGRGCAYLTLVLPYDEAAGLIDPEIAAHVVDR